MKKLFLLLLLGCMGCQSSVKVSDTTQGMTAKEIIEKDVFIDLTPSSFVESRSAASMVATAEFRAACYRFYRNVSYDENNIGTCKVHSGAELKMSEELFIDFLRDMENLNELIRKDLANGIKGQMPPKDEAYFKRLLEEPQ